MHPKASNQNIYRAPEDYEREGAENRYAQEGADARAEIYRGLHPYWTDLHAMTPRQVHHAAQMANMNAAVEEHTQPQEARKGQGRPKSCSVLCSLRVVSAQSDDTDSDAG
jgi:hypothetical protein